MAEGALMSAFAVPFHVWTFEDLETLPDEFDTRRWEIVDGALVVTPSPDMRHESVSERLRGVLRDAGTPDFFTVGPMAVDLGATHRVPDIMVVRTELARTRITRVPPGDALLVVEIVSPSSTTTDRITKPAQYAQHGIATYLRVETDPDVTITVYELAGDVYRVAGTYGPGQTARLERPFVVDIAVDDITP